MNALSVTRLRTQKKSLSHARPLQFSPKYDTHTVLRDVLHN